MHKIRVGQFKALVNNTPVYQSLPLLVSLYTIDIEYSHSPIFLKYREYNPQIRLNSGIRTISTVFKDLL